MLGNGIRAPPPPKLILFVLSSRKKKKKEVLVKVSCIRIPALYNPIGFRLSKKGTEFLDSLFNTLRCYM